MTLSNLTTNSLYRAQAGLLGAGRWATITAMTGTPTRSVFTDANGVEWTAFKWTATGSVTTTAGLVEAVVVSGGGGTGTGSYERGWLSQGITRMPAATNTVTVGAGGSGDYTANRNGAPGGNSSVGDLAVIGGAGGEPNGTVYPLNKVDVPALSVTWGTLTMNNPANDAGGWQNGKAGCVAIRVPSAFVTATSGWA